MAHVPTARRVLTSTLIAPLALGAVLFSAPVTAQQGENVLEEIVVTARFREERLQDTPIAITAMTAEEIELRAFTSAFEVAYTVPNASMRPAQAAYGNSMTAYIRGIGQYDFDQAFEPGVGIYVDDVYQPFMLGTQLDLIGVERVETLRGPQGTLFGRGSIGGVMRLVSRVPQGDDTGFIRLTVGDYDRIDVNASYDFALSDTVFAQVSAASRKRSGYQDVVDFACRYPNLAGTLPVRDPSRGRNCITGTQGGEDMNAFRGALRWVPNDNVEFRLTADVQNDESEARADTLVDVIYPVDASGNLIATSGYVLFNDEYINHDPATPGEPWGFNIPYDDRFIPPNIYETYATYDDPRTGLTFRPTTALKREAVSATLHWDMSETMRLTVIGSYTDFESQLVSDADASPFNFQTTGGQQDFDWSTLEVRLSGRAADRLDWTVGAFYYDGTAANHQLVSFPPILWGIFRAGGNGLSVPETVFFIEELATYSVNTKNIADAENTAVFGHLVFDLTDSLTLNVGARYSEDSKDVDFDNSFFVGPIIVDDDHTDWRIGLDWKANDDVLLYGSVATGYRPPAYNPRPFTAAQAVAVGGEEATAYEIGLKTDLLDNTLRLNLAAFFTDYDKRIVPIGGTECIPPLISETDPGAILDSNGNYCLAVTSQTSYQQLRDGEVVGYEFEFHWQPTDAFSVNGVYGYTDWSSPEVDNCDLNLDGEPDPGVICSNAANFVPEYNWTLGAAYEIPLSSGARLTPRADIYGQTEICSSFASQASCSDGYELVNVRLQWVSANADWTIAVGATNVTDEEYWLNKFDLTLFGQNTVEGQPGRPQEWYVSFTRDF